RVPATGNESVRESRCRFDSSGWDHQFKCLRDSSVSVKGADEFAISRGVVQCHQPPEFWGAGTSVRRDRLRDRELGPSGAASAVGIATDVLNDPRPEGADGGVFVKGLIFLLVTAVFAGVPGAKERAEIRKALRVPDPLPALSPETLGKFEP